jgi:hypothetical protein
MFYVWLIRLQGEVKKLVVQFSDEQHVTVHEQAVISLSANYIRGSFGKSCLEITTFGINRSTE